MHEAVDAGSVAVSIVVPSYQRCESLLRLLRSLDDALEVGDCAEVVVVLDGSTDGSREALERSQFDYPLRWIWQPNAGRSAARNAGLARARAPLCWLVDDDMTFDRAAFEAHVEHHRAALGPTVVMGAQLEPEDLSSLFQFLHDRADRLATTPEVTDPFDFWTGNISVPRQTLLEIGGFSEEFVGWGEEDVELGFRIRGAGIPICFEPAAGGQHWRRRPLPERIREERERGANLVRLCAAHPEAANRVFPSSVVIVAMHRHNARSPLLYGTIALLSEVLLRSERIRSSGQCDRIFNIGISASRLAGVLDAGGSEQLQQRVTISHRALQGAIGAITDTTPIPSCFAGRRAEYEATGLVRRCGSLADQSVLDELRGDADAFRAAVAEARADGLHRVPYTFTPAIERVACDPALVAVVEEILGDERWVAWGANIQIGTPNDAFEWHTDIESTRWPAITVVIGISGCRPTNATRYIPGSHRLPVGPLATGDPTDEELVLATAGTLDRRCREVVGFEGFGDGRFAIFDANGWHRGDTEASTDRVALFLHYQCADHLRIPMMRDFTEGTWFDHAAPYLPNPRLGDDVERRVHVMAPEPPSRQQRVAAHLRRMRRATANG